MRALRFGGLFFLALAMPPAGEFGAYVRSEIGKWGRGAKGAGIRAD